MTKDLLFIEYMVWILTVYVVNAAYIKYKSKFWTVFLLFYNQRDTIETNGKFNWQDFFQWTGRPVYLHFAYVHPKTKKEVNF